MVINHLGIVPGMEFQVLGPLRVVDAEAAYPLGGAKARSLLAMLVARAGSPVAMNALLMGMYGADVDPKQRRSVQTYVSTYRRLLGDVIERRSDGYVLAVPPEDIDAVRFETSLETARSLVDQTAASAMLRDALGLWRGSPYADVEARAVLQAEIRRLEELRADAIETLVELQLATGRHRELIHELETLVAELPTRERLRSSLMLALYRSGRQADAIHACRAAEEYLREELGLEPSPEMRQLELQILQQDERLDYRPRPQPRAMPARYTSFVGRTTEVAEVGELVRNRRLVTVTGPGGIGKTSLAAEVGRTLATEMAVSFVPIEAHRSAEVESVVASSLGLQPAENAEVLDLIGRTIGETPTLLLLDGCEHVIERMPGLAAGLLQRSSSLRLLITSREALFVTGEHRYALGPLAQGPGSAADHVFADRAQLRLGELDEDSAELVTTISARLAGIPLALELAAARARTLSLGEIAHRLDQQVELLTSSRSANERHASLLHALDWSYRLLDERHQFAFRRLAVFRSKISLAAAAFVLDDQEVIGRLEHLADVSLLVRDGDGYVVLEPIRQYARRQLEASGDVDMTRQRYAEWTVAWSQELRDHLLIDRDSGSLSALRDAVPEIEVAALWARNNGMPEIVVEVVAAIGRPWILVADGKQLREAAYWALDAAGTPNPALLAATAHTALMFMEHDREVAVELMRRSQALLSEVQDAAARFFALSAMGKLSHYLELEPRDDEIRLLDAAIELAADAGYPPAHELRNRALALMDAGRTTEAAAIVDDVVEDADESDPWELGSALLLRALLHRIDGALEPGLADARDAARLIAEAGNFDQAAQAEFEKAKLLVLLGQSERAARALETVDQLHGYIGLPPTAVYDPPLAARIAGDLGRWPEFEQLVAAWIADLPDDERLRMYRLAGDHLAYSHVVVLLTPTIRWLAAVGRQEEAARLAAASEMALAATSVTPWERIGEAQRLRAAVEQVAGDRTPVDVPEDIQELFAAMAASFAAPG